MESENPQIFVIADYGVGDPAFTEVVQRITALMPDARIERIYVRHFNTTQTGFWVYQIALNDDAIRKLSANKANTYIYVNTAPRRDDPNPRKEASGEGLAYAKLKTGMEIVGVNSGETFSFVKPMIEKLFSVNVSNMGSQFRSRDIFPKVLAQIVNGDYSCLGAELSLDSIPEPKGSRIAHVDGYGNIKTTIHASDVSGLKLGDSVKVSINQAEYNAKYADSIFGVKEGELCFAAGSSGPKENRFMEISKRLGSAWKLFGKPEIGTEIKWGKA